MKKVLKVIAICAIVALVSFCGYILIKDIKNNFKEFSSYKCEYQDCMHLKEVGCNINEILLNKTILK